MCRYAMSGPYKDHYACFACRKVFKHPPIEDYLAVRGLGYVFRQLVLAASDLTVLVMREQELGHSYLNLVAEYHKASHKCAECGEPMIDMGLDFKAPAQRDTKAWRILKGMYQVGHVFHTCGCDGPGLFPKSPAAYREYLATRRADYVEQLSQVQKSDTFPFDRVKAAEHWGNLIDAIDRELTAIRSP